MLQRGTLAPDFELYTTPDQRLHLNDLKGKKVILAFYPADWSPVCSDQMALYNETLKLFRRHNAQVIGISRGFKMVPHGFLTQSQSALSASCRF